MKCCKCDKNKLSKDFTQGQRCKKDKNRRTCKDCQIIEQKEDKDFKKHQKTYIENIEYLKGVCYHGYADDFIDFLDDNGITFEDLHE